MEEDIHEMPMDADAREMMELLDKFSPLPRQGTVAREFRAAQEAALKARPVVAVDVTRVETFDVPGQDGPVRVRLYVDGTNTAPRPAMLYMHGGGFVICSIDSHDSYCRMLAKDTGMAVLSVDYRLAPEHPYPAAFHDGRDALLWLAGPESAAKGIDTSHITVAGDSAGGALAAALSLWSRDHGGPAIAHQLLVYPVIANDFTTSSYEENAEGYYLTRDSMRWFWAQYLGDSDLEADMFATPGRAADLSGLPPATIVTAGYDPLRDEAADYARRLEAAGVPVLYRDFSGTFHGFANMTTLQSSRDLRALIVDRLRGLSNAG